VKLAAAVLAVAVVAIWTVVAQADGRVDAAERQMTAAYTVLVGKLGGAAKAHLEADQARWLGERRACDANPPRQAECLEFRYRQRAQVLTAVAKGTYPFISQQAIVQSGNGPNGRYAVDVAYPRFDGQSAGFVTISRRFAAAAEEEAADAKATGSNEITQTPTHSRRTSPRQRMTQRRPRRLSRRSLDGAAAGRVTSGRS
jgi:hypothetical protein